MTDGTHEREVPKPSTVPDRSPAIPALSKDAWELIQYRLWDHLRGKMWTTLSIFLTLVTVAGLLGVPAFISARVDAKIADEKAKFEQLRSEFAADRSRILTLSSTSSYAAFLWVQSLADFQRAHLEALSDLEKPRYSKDDKARQTWRVFRLLVTRFDLHETATQFRPSVRQITAFLDCECVPAQSDYSADPLTEAEWSRFELASNKAGFGPRLPQLYAMYSHILALKATLLRSNDLTTELALKDPSRRAALYEQYNAVVYPAYREALNRMYGSFPPPIGRRESDPWRWLPETAVASFAAQESRSTATK